MILTFKEIQRRVGRRVQNVTTSTTNANDILPKIKDWINERYERILRLYPWEENLGDTTLTIVASQRAYAMDRGIDKIWAIFDQTNGRIISIKDVQSYVRGYAVDNDQTGNVQTGDPTRCYPIGSYTVKNITHTSAEKVTISSSHASDVTPSVVHIRGLVSGVENYEDIVLNGTGGVDSGLTYDAAQKLQISVGTSDGSVLTLYGTITVIGKTSTSVLTKVSRYDMATLYRWYEVNPLPKATGTQPTWRIFYGKRMMPMVADNDIPVIDCSQELIQGAFADAMKEDGEAWQDEETIFTAMVEELKASQDIPGRIEQFIPDSGDMIGTLDYGRQIGVE